MSKHTPTPWNTNEFGAVVSRFSTVCGTDFSNNSLSDEERAANAALIATAPDLLAALEKLIEFAQPALEAQGFGYMGSFEQARAAIAKAKGQQLT